MDERNVYQTLMSLEKAHREKDIVRIVESHKYDKNPAFLYYLAHLYYNGIIYDKDINQAIEYLRASAMGGYASACFMLCTLFERGDGVERDYKISNEYLIQAVDKGYIPAINHMGELQLMGRLDIEIDEQAGFAKFKFCHEQGYLKGSINYGYCLLYGVGCEAQPEEGVELLKKYADEGHMEAQYNLGKAYFDGIGVAKDIIRANYYLQEATERGHMFAAKMLGDCYYDGIGVPIDHATAFKFYRKAAQLGNTDAAELVTHCYVYGDGVQPDYKEAISYLVRRAQEGDGRAQVVVGNHYYNGNGFRKNMHRAFHWYQEAAKQDEPEGFKRAGDMLLEGLGCKKDPVKAVSYYEKAMELKFYDAALPLAKIYSEGVKGVNRDETKATKYYRDAYRFTHDPECAFEYGERLSEGLGCDKDYDAAYEAYLFGAKKGHLESIKRLGECYLKGRGVEQDYEKALRYYLMASKKGDEEAAMLVSIIRRDIELN